MRLSARCLSILEHIYSGGYEDTVQHTRLLLRASLCRDNDAASDEVVDVVVPGCDSWDWKPLAWWPERPVAAVVLSNEAAWSLDVVCAAADDEDEDILDGVGALLPLLADGPCAGRLAEACSPPPALSLNHAKTQTSGDVKRSQTFKAKGETKTRTQRPLTSERPRPKSEDQDQGQGQLFEAKTVWPRSRPRFRGQGRGHNFGFDST